MDFDFLEELEVTALDLYYALFDGDLEDSEVALSDLDLDLDPPFVTQSDLPRWFSRNRSWHWGLQEDLEVTLLD